MYSSNAIFDKLSGHYLSNKFLTCISGKFRFKQKISKEYTKKIQVQLHSTICNRIDGWKTH